MTPDELRRRTKDLAVSAATLAKPMLADATSRHAAAQLIRSSASVAANYRAAGQARSRAEFLSKLSVVVEEADESVFWLEYLQAIEPLAPPALASILDEARQLVRIFSAARRTVRHTMDPRHRRA